ncbi:MAG: LPS export ABC transporter periplasmic protein LptC [Burkholderiales bacterium]
MKGAADRAFPLALMLALALLTFWLDRTVREEDAVALPQRHDPDYIVSNFTVTNYNRDGKVESTLTARKMTHYPDDDSTELEFPHVVQTKPGEPRMTLTADRGALSHDGVDVFLRDNVVLVREAHEATPEQRVTSPFLHLVRERSLVRTDREVLIYQQDRELAGRGMVYNNDTGQFLLHERVRGRFDPRKPQ